MNIKNSETPKTKVITLKKDKKTKNKFKTRSRKKKSDSPYITKNIV